MNLRASLKVITFEVKMLWILLGQFLEKFGLLFVLISGHTGSYNTTIKTLRERKKEKNTEREREREREREEEF